MIRILSADIGSGHSWEFLIRGIDGKDLIGILKTNNEGRGLFTHELNLEQLGERVDLLSADEFHVKPESTRAQAKELLSEALIKLIKGEVR